MSNIGVHAFYVHACTRECVECARAMHHQCAHTRLRAVRRERLARAVVRKYGLDLVRVVEVQYDADYY